MLPFAAAAREGTPSYYQSGYGIPENSNQVYVGNRSSDVVVGQRVNTVSTPNPAGNVKPYTMTPNGVDAPSDDFELNLTVGRKFADFEFKTGVNSILEWDDMIFNEIGVSGRADFTLFGSDAYVFADYRHGFYESGGYSMDYDLEAFYSSASNEGIFTVSIGDQDGKTDYFRLGLGGRHVWNAGGWKFSPSFGYEIFKHDLEMFDHRYPNPATYIPALSPNGEYIFGNGNSDGFITVPQGSSIPAGYYQVCLGPEDLQLINVNGDGTISGAGLPTGLPGDPSVWGVPFGECVILGADGEIMVPGTTHKYNTTWSGFFIGMEVEKQLTYVDHLRFYAQIGMPYYSSEGIWPNRTDWQQDPSFVDEGSNGGLSYAFEAEYSYRISDNWSLSLKGNMDYYKIGKIGGELYVAGGDYFVIDENGQYLDEDDDGLPDTVHVAEQTEKIEDALKSAVWQSFGIHLGVKAVF